MTHFQTLLDAGIEFYANEFYADSPELTAQDIGKIEMMIEAPLPDQYRNYLLHSNGGSLDKHITDYDDDYCFTIHWPKENNLTPNEE
jgi:hypothetical protein